MKHTTETQLDTPSLDALKTLHAGFDAASSRMVAALLGTHQSFQVAKEKILMGMQRDSKQMNTGKR